MSSRWTHARSTLRNNLAPNHRPFALLSSILVRNSRIVPNNAKVVQKLRKYTYC